jgi:hypothetical protein
MFKMTLPKSKMLSASRSIMAIANRTRETREISSKTIQNQTVNITLPRNSGDFSPSAASRPETAIQHPTIVAYPQMPTLPEVPINTEYPSVMPTSIDPPAVETPQNTKTNEDLINLYNMLNNYETVAKALILIIDLIQSNPLKINKYIVPTEKTFRDLICVLTNAEDVDIKRVEEVGCTLSSKKYDLIDDIFVITDGDPKSLKYGYPEVARLFDRFGISIKMIAY